MRIQFGIRTSFERLSGSRDDAYAAGRRQILDFMQTHWRELDAIPDSILLTWRHRRHGLWDASIHRGKLGYSSPGMFLPRWLDDKIDGALHWIQQTTNTVNKECLYSNSWAPRVLRKRLGDLLFNVRDRIRFLPRPEDFS